jgi:hypothetical protein
MNEHYVENAPPVQSRPGLTALRRLVTTRRYRKAHREQIVARKARHYQANRDRILELRRTHYGAHREELKEKRRARFELNQQRKHKRAKREMYLWRHPEAIAWYDAEVRRRERFERDRSGAIGWYEAERRRKARYLRRLQRRQERFLFDCAGCD